MYLYRNFWTTQTLVLTFKFISQALQDLTLAGAVSKREAWASKTPPPTEEDETEFLYDSNILSDLASAKELSAKDKSLYFRPLQSDDYNRGYIELLKQLTSVGDVTELDFKGINLF